MAFRVEDVTKPRDEKCASVSEDDWKMRRNVVLLWQPAPATEWQAALTELETLAAGSVPQVAPLDIDCDTKHWCLNTLVQ